MPCRSRRRRKKRRRERKKKEEEEEDDNKNKNSPFHFESGRVKAHSRTGLSSCKWGGKGFQEVTVCSK
jgi:hypothetical protein